MEKITFEQLHHAVTQLYEKVSGIEKILLSQAQQQLEVEKLLTVQQTSKIINALVLLLFEMLAQCFLYIG